MEQLLLHLFGDYVTQTDWMANRKRKFKTVALFHAFIYSIPFLLLTPSLAAFLVIFLSHALIDHFALARYLIYAKNWVTDPNPVKLPWKECSITGYPITTPIWLSTWLLIITDNFLHLLINYLALKYL